MMSESTISEEIIEPDWEAMKSRWPSSVVVRARIGDFSGGLFSPSRMANLGCNGEGPPSFHGINNKVFYEVESLVLWMRDRFLAGQMRKAPTPPKRRGKNAILLEQHVKKP